MSSDFSAGRYPFPFLVIICNSIGLSNFESRIFFNIEIKSLILCPSISKKIINLSLSNIQLKFGKEKITAVFIQNYKSGNLNQTSNKTLVFIEENGDWLILEETSG